MKFYTQEEQRIMDEVTVHLSMYGLIPADLYSSASNDGKPMLAAVLGDKRYESELAAYLNDGVNYGANTISKADQGDLEQLAADSFFAGYRAAVERLTNGG